MLRRLARSSFRKLRSRQDGKVVIIAAAVICLAGCSAQLSKVGTSAPTFGTSTSSPAPASTMPAPLTVPPTVMEPSGPPVQNLNVTQAVLDELLTAFAQAKGIDAAQLSGPVSGSVFYSFVAGTGTFWATARFTPSADAKPQTGVSLQDGGDSAIFSHRSGNPWTAVIGHVPWPCPQDIPADVLTAWGMTYANSCVFASPTPAQLDSLVIDSSVIPQGFNHQETEGGPGQPTSAGQSLATAHGYWVRADSPPEQDDISVFLNLFSSSEQAISYNSTFSKEYTGNGAILEQTTVPGVPGSTAYLNGGSPGGGPGSSAQPLPPTATAWFNVGGIAVGIYVSDYRESPLPIAQQLALDQYKRLLQAVSNAH